MAVPGFEDEWPKNERKKTKEKSFLGVLRSFWATLTFRSFLAHLGGFWCFSGFNAKLSKIRQGKAKICNFPPQLTKNVQNGPKICLFFCLCNTCFA